MSSGSMRTPCAGRSVARARERRLVGARFGARQPAGARDASRPGRWRRRHRRAAGVEARALGRDDPAVNLVGELLDALTDLLRDPGELRVLLQQLEDLGRLLRRQLLSPDARL